MSAGEPELPPDDGLGIVRRADFAARGGMLLVWHNGVPELVAYAGDTPVAVLLVVADEAVPTLQQRGLAAIPTLLRRALVHPYMLKTLGQLEELGMDEFVEDLGLVFPKH